MFYLALHSDVEQHEEIEQQDWPEDRHVKYREEGHGKAYEEGPGRRVPVRIAEALGKHMNNSLGALVHD